MAFFLDTQQSFGESLASSGIGFLIVFIGLICLIALVSLMGSICGKVLKDDKKTAKKAPAAPAKSAPVAPVAPAAPAAIANRDELVVAFSAAVAEELGTDVSAIRVVSLKEIG
jgi:sodium pump decarboxylase gamma subunit